MKDNNTFVCTICGKEYHYCPKCESVLGYKFYTDTRECYKVFHILEEYREGIITQSQAKQMFANIGITSEKDIVDFIEPVQVKIKEILSYQNKTDVKKYQK